MTAAPDIATGRLTNRRIVITGAASGIGRATAELFLEEGAKVILVDRDGEGARAALSSGEGIVCELDITDADAVAAAMDAAAKQMGGIDGLVNSAGIMLTAATPDLTPEIWQRTIDVNLSGSFHMVRATLPWLQKERGATIVNIASGAGLLPNTPGLVAYAASKGGVIAMTKALAADLAPEIRVNCVAPGMVDTPMAKDVRHDTSNYALKRFGDSKEIAEALLYLTSPVSSYVTGITLPVDGGRTFH
jgi:NAD(P)-dependent dehydrogenase (short-subunit alcohol dehydrogenase family)